MSQQPLLLHSKQNYSSIESRQYIQGVLDFFSPALYLENTLAVARDHLANERTFLAWVRTSLSTISVGIALTQLFRLEKENKIGRPLGMLFIIISMMYMVFACIRYFHSQSALTQGYFPASQSIILITFIVTLSALLLVLALIIS
ncbi:hypothetical protein CU098_004305, partial [Rhizopus stolonifer]